MATAGNGAGAYPMSLDRAGKELPPDEGACHRAALTVVSHLGREDAGVVLDVLGLSDGSVVGVSGPIFSPKG